MNKDLTWAEQIVGKVLAIENRKHAPKIKFVFSRGHYSSGRTFSSARRGYQIFIRVGTDEQDKKGVLIHELAHWLLRSGHHHDMAFWKKAWSLYFLFENEFNMEVLKKREFEYKQKAERAFYLIKSNVEAVTSPRRIAQDTFLAVSLIKTPKEKKLKPKKDLKTTRQQQAELMVKKYTSKVKRDTNLLKKWQRKLNYYQKSTLKGGEK